MALPAFLLCLGLMMSAAQAQPVVLISIDGMNRAFYQSSDFPTPELKQMAKEGASAERMLPIFPSLTYPDHAALVTGCPPALSGVSSNIMVGKSEWYWNSKYLKATPIWKAAAEKGLRVALMGWPTTQGAKVAYNIPEVFYAPGTGPLTTEQRIEKYSTPGTMKLLGVKVPEDFPTWDVYMTGACEKLLSEHRVDLLLVHLIQVDKAEHSYGPDAPQVKEAAANVDAMVGRIRRAAGPHAVVAVVGDHGFRPYRQVIYPKKMLKEGGFPPSVQVHAMGGSAAFYHADKAVEQYFRGRSDGRYRIVTRDELDRFHTLPGASFAITALGPVMFTYKEDGPPEETRVMGQHGHLPWLVPTGWVMTGPGIAPGSELGECQIVDVAPTLAHRLGLSLPQATGVDRLVRRWFWR